MCVVFLSTHLPSRYADDESVFTAPDPPSQKRPSSEGEITRSRTTCGLSSLVFTEFPARGTLSTYREGDKSLRYLASWYSPGVVGNT
jgi:hypothetical protein